MAGVVAMASVIEDFDTQPCKKARKDGGSPIVKTITNYFSPLPKPAEKPFSPPRSNNIMDYFSKRPNLVSKEKSSSPEQPKESCQKNQSVEKQSTPEALSKQPPQKRRKKTNVSRKLVEDKAVDEDCSFVVQDSPERNVSAPKSRKPSQKKQKRAEKCLVENECKTVEPTEEDCSIEQPEVQVISSSSPSSVVLPKDKVKRNRKPAAKSKKDDEPVKQIEAEVKEAASFLSDASMEVNVDENSELNSSTVMISFEDFVRSHSQDDAEEVGDDEQCKAPSVQVVDEVEIKENEPLQPPVSNEASGEAPLQVPQRTLTIQAEVHKCKEPVGKVASIFNKRNVVGSPAEVASVGKSPSPTVKRRSNVVLLEEELELLVLESDSTSKCSESERKQFMAAFKQAGKVAKTQEKLKKPADKDAEEGAARPPVDEQAPPVAQGDKVVKKKPGRKTKKKANVDSAAATQSPAEEAVVVKENKTGATESNDSAPATRRSLRGGAGSRTPIAPQMDGSAKPAAEEASLGTPVSISTPRKRKSRHGVFVAELVCPPDTKESPIRIRLTRVRRDSDKGENGVNSPLSSKNESEKQKQAKKLVEKAKAIKKSKKAVEVKGTLRRSSRSETSASKTYCEDEDSIICLDDAPAAPAKGAVEKNKPKKSLRSLNDVLGKQASHGKGSKQTTASQEKNVRKVSIFDESSREGSENSQDDEQFKARREFLKSGLPENFRKQIAKAAATREAYSAQCLSFQSVLHATQPPTDCPLWSLPWPKCPLLSDLKEPWSQKISSALSCSGHFSMKTEAARKVSHGRVSGWRPDIAADVLQILIEDVRSCNSSFPVQMFLTRLKTKCSEYHQLCSSEAAAKVTSTDSSVKAGGKGKRKRLDDDGVKAAKKQRAGLGDDSVSVEVEPSRRARRRRSAQKQSVAEKKEAASVSGEDSPSKDDASVETDVVREDVLWTDKYQPQHSSDIVGNTASVRRLHSWLKEWKLRADREEKRQREPKKPEDSSVDSDWDGGDDSVFAEDGLCNTVLITGPTGVGKTAAVYACAQELGFKVFEVNASSQRSGRLILSQLREATQSHQVDSQGVNAHKPTYFTSYSTGSSTSSVKHGISPRKMNSPRRVVSSPRKLPQSPRGSKRGGLAPTSLAKFFKPGADSSKKEHQKSKSSTHEAPLKSKNTLKSPTSSTEEQSKKTATSLILFEEVDVIFEEDSGFLAAIKTFMATTKRPVILTTSDPAFSTMFDGHFEEIHFKTPSLVNVCSYLRLLCLTENLRTDASDVNALLRLNNCDVRQSLLQMQFWARSAGGRHDDRQLQARKDGEAGTSGEVKDLPLCDTGCTESALGLINSQTEKSIWDLLKTQTQDVASWALLVEGLRRGFNLTYSNMESLVPLPQKELEPFTKKPQLSQREKPLPVPPPEPTSFLPSAESDDGSPVKLSHRMKKNKRTRQSADKGGLQSDSDSGDGFLSLSKPQPDLKEEMNKNLTVRSRALTAEERLTSLPVSQGLQAIADFFDSMSFADSFTQRNPPALSAVKDGMMDEPRMDCDRSSCEEKERVLEVQAAVEALSFHKCRTSLTEARDQALKLDEELGRKAMEELTLPVAPHRASFSFTAGDPCPAHLATHRRDVMDSLVCRGAFGAVDRRLMGLDYLPTLRTICRSEQLKEQEKVKRRFLHYLDSIHLGVDRETLQHLAEEFPGSHTRLKPCR
ncbi:ATPase family AAA domain-containing protein 5 isoform X1 [Synchiropus splendidus]|uniref:ATPase family AAA domain-containing protein 5 isoform X1 n=1 Tax=Synchiropus splendidus TaxID=270530 RepID=UPI00237D9E72|nr:ATPase family AAA domain-containing protein 5 isoform X1 [Synchiropus splendidus]